MDEVIKTVLQGFPTFAGLVVLAYVLYKQNDKLLTALIGKIDQLQVQIDQLRDEIKKFRQS